MIRTSRLLSYLTLPAHLGCVHLVIFLFWYHGGGRGVFRKPEHIKDGDLQLAVSVAESAPGVISDVYGTAAVPPPGPAPSGEGRVAFLFMLKSGLTHLEAWRGWLAPELGRSNPRVSLYFHLSDGAEAPHDAVLNLTTLPGARRVVPTVATGWCELMAAEVALYQAALADDPEAEIFVLLPGDALPLVPLEVALATLLGENSPGGHAPTRICPAGVRGLDVPVGCAHGIEPHWARAILLKHHQWTALSRAHAAKVADARRMRAAVGIFMERYEGEPLCSDEVLPLLALALPAESWLGEEHNHSAEEQPLSLDQVPLYQGATRGLPYFEDELRALGVTSGCITYAPWPGCHGEVKGSKFSSSPLSQGGMSPAEQERLVGELVGHGILFGRKLDVLGGSASQHLARIEGLTSKAASPPPSPPPRLLPKPEAVGMLELLWQAIILARWFFSIVAAREYRYHMMALYVSGSVGFARMTVHNGTISRTGLKGLQAVFLVAHVVPFFMSVMLSPKHSLLEPLRRVGMEL